MTLTQALTDSPAPPEILAEQTLLNLPFIGFNGESQIGQLVVNCAVAAEVAEIFRQILLAQFPIESMIPVVAFGWSDDASMEANNSSGFNFRRKVGKSSLSAHATGHAIDINPRQNPYISGDLVLPPGARFDSAQVGTLTTESAPVRIFESFGWIWGGRWTTLHDYHHFEKPNPL